MIFKSPKQIHAVVEENLRQRQDWSRDQDEFFKIRFFGLQRQVQYDWQSNIPFKLADSIIERIKPQDIAHVFNGEILAEFTSRDPIANTDATVVLGQAWDYELRNRSNFTKEIMSIVDMRCMYGGAFMSFDYDYKAETVNFQALRSLDVVVPQGVQHIDKAANFCIITHTSPVDFVLDGNYSRNDEKYIKKLIGERQDDSEDLQDSKESFYGLDENTSMIEVRRYYQRCKDGWYCYFYCPNDLKNWLREPYMVPYEVDGRAFAPVVFFPFEITDTGGIYDTRGIVQKVADEEAELTSMRNLKQDAVKVASLPFIKSSIDSAVASNITIGTLKSMPNGMSLEYFPFPNVNYDVAMNEILGRTEQRVGAFDNTITDIANKSGDRSATEAEMIGSIASQGTNARYRIFRSSLCELYKKAYAVWRYHNPEDTKIVLNGQEVTIPKAIKSAKYDIQPAGSEVTWSKERRTQQAMQIYQTLGQSPTFAPYRGKWEKYMLSTIDPRFAAQYNPDMSELQANQREQQLTENLILDKGIRVPVSQDDDDAVHAITCYEDIARYMLEGKPMGQQESKAKIEHLQMHMQALKKKNKAAHDEVVNRIAQIKQTVENSVQQGMQQQQMQQPQMMQQQSF